MPSKSIDTEVVPAPGCRLQDISSVRARMQPELQFSVVERHISPWDAHITRALLESEGISAFLANEHHVSVNWPMSLMLGGVRVMVCTEDLEVARSTLALRDDGVLEAALLAEQAPIPLACANCGSLRFREERNWFAVGLAALLLLMLKVIYPPPKQRKCAACRAIT